MSTDVHNQLIVDRIELALSKTSYTARKASLEAGLSADFISKMRRRASLPKLSTLAKLASVLDVDAEWLINGDNGPEIVDVPAYEARPSAGDGALFDGDGVKDDPIPFSRRWLRKITSASPERLITAKIHGDSMSPTIPDGSWVLIDTSQTSPINNEIYVIEHEGDGRVKRVVKDPTAETVSLVSDNTLWAPVMVSDPSRLRVIGRVVWYSKTLV